MLQLPCCYGFYKDCLLVFAGHPILTLLLLPLVVVLFPCRSLSTLREAMSESLKIIQAERRQVKHCEDALRFASRKEKELEFKVGPSI